jgi:archaellum component FlaC
MNIDDYLNSVYYLDKDQNTRKALAVGEDAVLWEDVEKVRFAEGGEDEYSIYGYYPRIKKINDAIIPINKELIGLNKDLIEKKAKLEVEEATYETSVSGIEETREDFLALTGLYPEEIRTGNIDSVDAPSEGTELIVQQDDWWHIWTGTDEEEPSLPEEWTESEEPTEDGRTQFIDESIKLADGVKIKDTNVKIAIIANGTNEEVFPELKLSGGVKESFVASKIAKKITTNTKWDGIYLDCNYLDGATYLLTYEV